MSTTLPPIASRPQAVIEFLYRPRLSESVSSAKDKIMAIYIVAVSFHLNIQLNLPVILQVVCVPLACHSYHFFALL